MYYGFFYFNKINLFLVTLIAIITFTIFYFYFSTYISTYFSTYTVLEN